MNVFLIAYYIYIMPYRNLFQNIINILTEILLLIIAALSYYFISDPQEQNEQTRINFGWVIIGFVTLLVLIHLVSTAGEIVYVVRNLGCFQRLFNHHAFSKLVEEKKTNKSTTNINAENLEIN